MFDLLEHLGCLAIILVGVVLFALLAGLAVAAFFIFRVAMEMGWMNFLLYALIGLATIALVKYIIS